MAKKTSKGTNLAASIGALDNLVNSSWFKPEPGRNEIRILPAYHSEGPHAGLFFSRIILHRGVQVEGRAKTITCSKNYDPDALCPVCEFKSELEGSSSKKNSEVAKKLRPQDIFFINLVDRKDDTVKKYGLKKSMMKTLKSYLLDPDYGDITDPNEGMDVVIEKEGEGMDTRYTVKVRPKNTGIDHKGWKKEMKDIFKPGECGEAMCQEDIYDIMRKGFGKAFTGLVDPNFNDGSASNDEDEDENDESIDSVDLDSLDRAELKSFIKENDLDIKVKKKMSDDDIREAIEDLMVNDEEEDEEED